MFHAIKLLVVFSQEEFLLIGEFPIYPASVKFLAISLAKRRNVEAEYIPYPPPARVFLKKRRHCNVSIWEWNALRACFESVSNVFVFVFVFGKESEKSKFAEFLGV